MPVYRHLAQREKEAELVFRGEHTPRHRLFSGRWPGNFPPSIDVLVQGRFLRKKYKDPMTEDGEFQIIPVGGAMQPGQNPQQPQMPGQSGQSGQPGQSGRSGRSGGRGPRDDGPAPAPQPGRQPVLSGGQSAAGIMGVRSKSKETAIRIYKGGGTRTTTSGASSSRT